jgi:hypothetical protein
MLAQKCEHRVVEGAWLLDITYVTSAADYREPRRGNPPGHPADSAQRSRQVRLAYGRLYERRLWFGNLSKIRLNAYDNIAFDSHAIQSAAERISHDLEQCRYLARPVHGTRWITK